MFLAASLCLFLTCTAPQENHSANHKPAPATNSPATLNLYASTRAGNLSAAAKRALPLVYVPNSESNTVTVIDPARRAIVRTFRTGKLPQHVVPSSDMNTLWVTNNKGNSLTRIDPVTGKEGSLVLVDDPYNLYFTPDGKAALVIGEGLERIDFRDPSTMKLFSSVHVNCRGVDHLDFTADNKYAFVTCEFSGEVVKVDLTERKDVAYLKLQGKAMPQDIRATPDGKLFYVADMKQGGLHVIDAAKFQQVGFIATGKGTHGIVVGRGGSPFYIMNRGSNYIDGPPHGPGSITVLDPESQKILANWPIPGGGSPDMGNITADGKDLWISGRYDAEVYDIDVTSGRLVARIKVGLQPHGICVWPQPGDVCLGHTGNMR